MSGASPKDRPDFKYWMTPWYDRKKPSKEELKLILTELEKYSIKKFTLGRRFKLSKNFQSTPSGTGCTVIDTWPTTAIRWDKWSNSGRGSERHRQNLLFELDMCLEVM